MVIFKDSLFVGCSREELDVGIDSIEDEGRSSARDFLLELEREVGVIVGALRIAGFVNDREPFKGLGRVRAETLGDLGEVSEELVKEQVSSVSKVSSNCLESVAICLANGFGFFGWRGILQFFKLGKNNDFLWCPTNERRPFKIPKRVAIKLLFRTSVDKHSIEWNTFWNTFVHFKPFRVWVLF